MCSVKMFVYHFFQAEYKTDHYNIVGFLRFTDDRVLEKPRRNYIRLLVKSNI